jgi:uncharacterized cupin superfamily protein
MSVQTLPPDSGRRFGAGITVKVDSGQSRDFIAFESQLPPGWAGVPPHVHQAYDEAFYVLDGSVTFAVNGTAREWSAGSFVFVPRGAAHGFANPGASPAKVLIVATPGALQLVEEIYQLMDEHESFDIDQMMALYARHHSQILTSTAP